MLTKAQQKLAQDFFAVGFSDVAITEKLGLPDKSIYVFQYRKSLGIEAKTVLQNRHQAFLDLASDGVSDEEIAMIYGAKKRSIYVTLCSYGFRRKDQKRTIKKIAEISGSTAAKKVPSKKVATKSVVKSGVKTKNRPATKQKPKA